MLFRVASSGAQRGRREQSDDQGFSCFNTHKEGLRLQSQALGSFRYHRRNNQIKRHYERFSRVSCLYNCRANKLRLFACPFLTHTRQLGLATVHIDKVPYTSAFKHQKSLRCHRQAHLHQRPIDPYNSEVYQAFPNVLQIRTERLEN